MNKGIFFICIWFLIGCSNRKEFAPTNDVTTTEEVAAVSLENVYAVLIQEKIQDHIDKRKLAETYPSFKQGIDTTATFHIAHKDPIQAIELLDEITLEDGKPLDIRTVIIYDTHTRDTVITTIQRTKILLDGEEIISSKVDLKNIKN